MNNLVTTTTTGGFDLEPKDLSEAKELASMIASTNLVPKQYQGKPADCLVCIMMGNELKLKAMQSLQHIAVINGKPSIYGDAMLAIVRNHPEFNKIEETFDEETETAFCAIHRRGQAVVEQRFSKADAITAGLWGKKGASGQPSAWVTYPRRMLQMRARGFALRDAFADALLGLITSEEARDIPSELVEDPIPEATSTEYAVADLNASLARLEQKEANEEAEKKETESLEISEAFAQDPEQDPEPEPKQVEEPPAEAKSKKQANPRRQGGKSKPHQAEIVFSYADIAEKIKASASSEAVLEALDLSRDFPDDQKGELKALADQRIKSIG